MILAELINDCHANAKAKGFWDNKRNIGEMLMLIVSELAEAMEADRHDDRENFVEEIADTCIRIFDLCGGLGIDLEEAIVLKMRYNATRDQLHGKKY
jgi:NTP pyrophosphatase (non-canonical NTP hydrolase)